MPEFNLTTMATPTEQYSNVGRVLPVEGSNITLHSTHSSISYLPPISCYRRIFWRCTPKFEPWLLNDYLGRDGRRHSFHSMRNGLGNEASEAREVRFSVRARAVYVWGAPRKQLYPFGFARQEICMSEFLCQPIDIESAYFDVPDESPALIWFIENLDHRRTHSFALRLIEPKGRNDRIMSLQEIVYDSVRQEEKHHEIPKQAILINRTIENTDTDIHLTPPEHCVRYWFFFSSCTKRWETISFGVLAEDANGYNRRVVQESFSQVRTVSASPSAADVPEAFFWFKGSAVYVFGVPPSHITLPHAAQEICIDGACEFLDVHEAYLNPRISGHLQDHDADLAVSEAVRSSNTSLNINSVLSPHPDERSVLLWYAGGLQWNIPHHVSLRMIERNPPKGGRVRAMTIDYVAYTSVTLPPKPPIFDDLRGLLDEFFYIIVLIALVVLVVRSIMKLVLSRGGIRRSHYQPVPSQVSPKRPGTGDPSPSNYGYPAGAPNPPNALINETSPLSWVPPQPYLPQLLPADEREVHTPYPAYFLIPYPAQHGAPVVYGTFQGPPPYQLPNSSPSTAYFASRVTEQRNNRYEGYEPSLSDAATLVDVSTSVGANSSADAGSSSSL